MSVHRSCHLLTRRLLLSLLWLWGLGMAVALPAAALDFTNPLDAPAGPLPALQVTKAVATGKHFRAADHATLAIDLPDEKLTAGRVYHIKITWTVPDSFHLNGPLAGSPDTPHCTLRLLGADIETGLVSYTGTLQASGQDGVAPFFHEKTVTADLPFRVRKNAAAAGEVSGTLEIDSSFCSDSSCYDFVCSPFGGQRYAVTFQMEKLTAASQAAAPEAFSPPRLPPITPAGGAANSPAQVPATAPGPSTAPAPAGGTAAAGAEAGDRYKVTQLTRVAGSDWTPKGAQIRIELPDAVLTPGKVYRARVTWTVGAGMHLNGPMAGDAQSAACRFSLTGPGIATDGETYAGTLKPAAEAGAAPYFAEPSVTATVEFRVAPPMQASSPTSTPAGTVTGTLGGTLAIDTSYCSEKGACYDYTAAMRRGENYRVTFQVASQAAAVEPFTPAGSATAPVAATNTNAGGTAAQGSWWTVLWSDAPMKEKIQIIYDAGGLPVLMLVVLVFGVLTTGLPCTYPLIPITSRILGAQPRMAGAAAGGAAAGEIKPGEPTRSDAFVASLFYMFGLTAIYGVIGGLGADGGRLITALNDTTWFNLAIAALFGLLALGMYGVIEIKVPNALATRLGGGGQPGQRRQGLWGNAARGVGMGTLAAILAGACTAPVVIAAIVLITRLGPGSFWRGFAILAPFGLGFGIPYFLLTNFVGKLPAPGQWMELLKILFGTAILICAFYFWNNTVPNPTLFALVVGVSLLAVGLGFGALDRLEAPVEASKRTQQVATLALAVIGGFYLVVGMQRLTGGETPAGSGDGPTPAATVGADGAGQGPAVAAGRLNWEPITQYDAGKPEADGRPVFIFFHSPSCHNCRVMQETTFRDPQVIALMQKVRLIDANLMTYGSAPAMRALVDKYNLFAQPCCLFLTADQKLAWGPGAQIEGLIGPDAMRGDLEKLVGK
ncbi:MAG: hypothetical protein ACREJ2_05940 [Planctomycetota bacterium]